MKTGITFRPPPELRARIREFADEHRWSLNTAIEVLVERGLDVEEGRG